MQLNIRDLAIFEKLTKVSRENNVYEVLCYLDVEFPDASTIINVLLRNVATGEYLKDQIAPEYMKFCSVGSYFKGGKKMVNRPPVGIVRDIEIDVPEPGNFHKFDSALAGTAHPENFLQKPGSTSYDYSRQCHGQHCMVFKQGTDTIVIPCSVIAASFYLTSHSMRVQLFAQNLEGLYEAINFDELSKTALIIMHRNARTEDAKRIARFHISRHAKKCWDNVMNMARERAIIGKKHTYYPLIAKIPVIQNDLKMTVRGTDLPNSEGGTTLLVHEILREHTSVPFRKIYCGRRGNAEPVQDPITITEKDAKPSGNLTNKPPSKAYKGKWVHQFGVPSNPLWEEVEFEEIVLPLSQKFSDFKTGTEQTDDTVDLSAQTPKGHDPDQKVAKADLQPPKREPKQNNTQRMALTAFREMVSEFGGMDGVSSLYMSDDLEVPLKGDEYRDRYTLRESYDKDPGNRRHYTYATFDYNGKHVCLVEIDQTGMSTRIGTYVLISGTRLGAAEALRAAYNFVQDSKLDDVEVDWRGKGVLFSTKSHPPKLEKDAWGSWRKRVLKSKGL